MPFVAAWQTGPQNMQFEGHTELGCDFMCLCVGTFLTCASTRKTPADSSSSDVYHRLPSITKQLGPKVTKATHTSNRHILGAECAFRSVAGGGALCPGRAALWLAHRPWVDLFRRASDRATRLGSLCSLSLLRRLRRWALGISGGWLMAWSPYVYIRFSRHRYRK